MNKKILLMLIFLTPSFVNADLLLFSNDNEFFGCLDCGRYDDDSICNRYGDYGSRYSDKSIWNRYGVGSRYDDNSPFNRYGTGLKIVDRDGNYYGYFSRSYSADSKTRNVLNDLWDSADGDYQEMRDIWCD